MSRVVVIGATGHIGTYLVPRLVRGGHEVIAISRGARDPYHASREWGSVRRVTVDRDAEDEQGTFGTRILALRPDVVIDLICFTAAAARQAAPAATAPAGGLSAESIARLQQLGDLLKQGILTDEEFAAQKAKVLGS